VVEAIRPHLQLNFENILSHINTIYVLQTRQGAMSSRHEQRFLRLKVSIGPQAIKVSGTVMKILDPNGPLRTAAPWALNLMLGLPQSTA